MPKNRGCILVFWGKSFDEATAALFVTELRQAGLRVKVVGLNGRSPRGAHGLSIVPDWTVTQAQNCLESINLIVLPCDTNLWHRVANDPRVTQLIDTVQANGGELIVSEQSVPSTKPVISVEQNLFAKCPARYPKIDRLLPFLQHLIQNLLSTQNHSLDLTMIPVEASTSWRKHVPESSGINQ